MSLNVEDARKALAYVEVYGPQPKATQVIDDFITAVERLLKNNAIKQEPALFKPFDKGE